MTAKKKEPPVPSKKLEEILGWIGETEEAYKAARAGRKAEDDRLQDLIHDVELAENKEAERKAAAALRESRRTRRMHKDREMELVYICNFFQEGTNRKILNGMRQLLGNQRKREEFLHGERHYNRRVKAAGEREDED